MKKTTKKEWRTKRLTIVTYWLLLVAAFIILFKSLDNAVKTSRQTSPKPSGSIVAPVVAKEPDPLENLDNETEIIAYIRRRGEEVGAPNLHIRTAIEIARAESNFRPTAKNKHSTATGIFQFIVSTYDRYDCEGSRLDAKSNINCFWKVYQVRKDGHLFKDWAASRSKWSKSL